jgi:hypothetical protein
VNKNTISAECAHGVCSACEYEDCACECHRRQSSHPSDDDREEDMRSAAIEAYWKMKQGEDYGSY